LYIVQYGAILNNIIFVYYNVKWQGLAWLIKFGPCQLVYLHIKHVMLIMLQDYTSGVE